MTDRGVFGPDFDHMALLVRLEERWLADVGFGDSFREPLLLDERTEQVQVDGRYRIDPAENDGLIVMRCRAAGEWTAQYRFGIEPRAYADFIPMCHYHQTSPESHFTQRRTCSLATADGRVTVSGMRLIITSGGERRERELADEAEYAKALFEYFGIMASA